MKMNFNSEICEIPANPNHPKSLRLKYAEIIPNASAELDVEGMEIIFEGELSALIGNQILSAVGHIPNETSPKYVNESCLLIGNQISNIECIPDGKRPLFVDKSRPLVRNRILSNVGNILNETCPTYVNESCSLAGNQISNIECIPDGKRPLFVDKSRPLVRNRILSNVGNILNETCPTYVNEACSLTGNQISNIEYTPDATVPMFVDESSHSVQESIDEKKLTRKRIKKEGLWKQNVRKKLRMSGKEYSDRKGRSHRVREMKSTCNKTCKKDCMANFSEDGRRAIFNDFWKLDDGKKLLFFSKYLKQIPPLRRRVKINDVEPRKKNTNIFFMELNGTVNQVCKQFFLSTLDVTDRQIGYYFNVYENKTTSIPNSPKRGKNTKSHISSELKSKVIDHINRFPRIQSHYCRKSTKRRYLDPQLSVPKMYNLYKQLPEVNKPLKLSMYRTIFNTEFNLSFHKPKKDMCDQCTEYNAKKKPTQEEFKKQSDHMERKNVGRAERNVDRENKNPTKAIIPFDLENVLALPKSNVCSAFYLRKLNTYNLTAYLSSTSTVYCVIWHEYIIGRGGNEIANAVVFALKKICEDHPELTHLVLWSDSCVPQNRNSIMSIALAQFVQSTDNNVVIIEQKFGEPGHGNIQEVDTGHSIIEAHLRHKEIWSPISLLKELRELQKLSVDNKYKFNIIEMMDLLQINNYHEAALGMAYSNIPFTKVKHLMYGAEDKLIVRFKKHFRDDFEAVGINKKTDVFPEIFKVPNEVIGITVLKIKDINAMIKFMTEMKDIDFYKGLRKKKLLKLKKNILIKNRKKIKKVVVIKKTKLGRNQRKIKKVIVVKKTILKKNHKKVLKKRFIAKNLESVETGTSHINASITKNERCPSRTILTKIETKAEKICRTNKEKIKKSKNVQKKEGTVPKMKEGVGNKNQKKLKTIPNEIVRENRSKTASQKNFQAENISSNNVTRKSQRKSK